MFFVQTSRNDAACSHVRVLPVTRISTFSAVLALTTALLLLLYVFCRPMGLLTRVFSQGACHGRRWKGLERAPTFEDSPEICTFFLLRWSFQPEAIRRYLTFILRLFKHTFPPGRV